MISVMETCARERFDTFCHNIQIGREFKGSLEKKGDQKTIVNLSAKSDSSSINLDKEIAHALNEEEVFNTVESCSHAYFPNKVVKIVEEYRENVVTKKKAQITPS
ncbi:7796_t:CDS:2 [Rhizophagus irregularis]|nr:7796_t:CDS:2 [Rhizophagus irregularis]